MSIGSTIKRLRHENDITQEQLAEYLGITSRAISQWECDRTAPDISYIPALCHIFDVSSDVLLGIDIARNNEIMQNYLDKALDEEYQGNFTTSVDILREANRKFPKSYKIMQRLASALVCVYCRKGSKEYDEVFGLCNRILAECTESNIRYDALETLGLAYWYAGKHNEMLKLAEDMPRSHYSYEHFMLYRWKGDADFVKCQEYISYLINQLVEMIGCISRHRHDNDEMFYSTVEQIELKNLQVKLLALVFPEGDYQYAAQYGEVACEQLVRIFLQNNDFENAWMWLEKGADFAIHMDTYDIHAPHSSLLFRGYSDGDWIMEDEGNRSQGMLDWLITDKETEVLRSDSRFELLVNRLKKVAKKP